MIFEIKPVSFSAADALQRKIDLKTKPVGSLGRLETIALQIGSIQQSLAPKLNEPKMFVFAGDHGIAKEGVSPFPQEVSFQMVMNFVGGGAAINAFCKQNEISLEVVDAGVNYDFPAELPITRAKIAYGTDSFLNGPAMTTDQCMEAFKTASELVQKAYDGGTNCVAFGEMGIANTSSSALIMHALTGVSLADCVGRGTGLDDEGLKKKLAVLEQAFGNYSGGTEPLAVLKQFGGFETAMVCGAFLKAAELGMTIIVDGFNISAALLVANSMNPCVKDYCIAAHVSNEKGHRLMLDFLGLKPVLDLGMRLGEGTGAAVAFPVIKSSLCFLNEMASFEDAGVSNK